MVGSELNALTISKRFPGSTDPSSRKYVTLLTRKHIRDINARCLVKQGGKHKPRTRLNHQTYCIWDKHTHTHTLSLFLSLSICIHIVGQQAIFYIF